MDQQYQSFVTKLRLFRGSIDTPYERHSCECTTSEDLNYQLIGVLIRVFGACIH